MWMCASGGSTRWGASEQPRLRFHEVNRIGGRESETMKTQTVLRAIARDGVCARELAHDCAYAGPSNRHSFDRTTPIYPTNLDGFGAPLPAIGRSLPGPLELLDRSAQFQGNRFVPQLGPLFNSMTCTGCHSQPSTGGGGSLSTRFACATTPIRDRCTSSRSTTCCATDRSRRAVLQSSRPEFKRSHLAAK